MIFIFSKNKKSGFTLVELVISIGVIGLIISIIIPAVQLARQRADLISCKNNVKEMALSLQNFHNTYNCFPSSTGSGHPVNIKRISWITMTLPYLGQEELWAATIQANQIQPLNQPNLVPLDPPHVGKSSIVNGLICHSDSRIKQTIATKSYKRNAFSSYVGFDGVDSGTPGNFGNFSQPAVFGSDFGSRISDMTDGTSNILIFGERPPPGSLQAGQWYSVFIEEPFGGPNTTLHIPQAPFVKGDSCSTANKDQSFGPGILENPCDRFHFWSLHAGGANFAVADGSVRFINYSSKRIVPIMATISGGEILTPD